MRNRNGSSSIRARRLSRLTVLMTAIAATIILAPGGIAEAQNDPTVEEISEIFRDTKIDDWTGEGFELTPDCVTAAGAGAPAELGVMGFHAVNPARIDFEIVAAEPEMLLVDGDGNVVGYEYEVPDQSQARPTLFGVEFDDTPPHPGFPNQHWSLHVWTIDNPLGQFSPWNPNLDCPDGSTHAEASHSHGTAPALALTGSETPKLAVASISLVIAGLMATSTSRRLRQD